MDDDNDDLAPGEALVLLLALAAAYAAVSFLVAGLA